MKRVAWFILFLVMGVSCLDQPDCFRQDLNLIGISFKKLLDGKADTVILYKVTGDGQPLSGDTSSSSGIALALNYLSESMTIAMEGLSTNNTLKLGFNTRPQFVSEECGERYIVSGLQILDKTLSNNDSVRIISNLPSSTAGTNIVIYRCPRTNIMRLSFRQLYMNTDSLGREDLRIVRTIATNSNAAKKYSPTAKYTVEPTKSVLLSLDTTGAIEYHFQIDNENKSASFTYHAGQKVEIIPKSKCGTQHVFGGLKINKTDFQILKVVNDSIYDPPFTNVISYRCPTTNLISILFREKKGDSKPASVTIKSLTSDYGDISTYLPKGPVSSLTLPLNPSSAFRSTKFTFVIGGETKILTIDYDVEDIEFHTECGFQPVFTALSIDPQSNFTAETILDASVKFPTVNNVEIIP